MADRFHVAADGLVPSPDIDPGRTGGDNRSEKIFVTYLGTGLHLPSPRSPDSRDGFHSYRRHSVVAVDLPDAHSCDDDGELRIVAAVAVVDVDAAAVAVVDDGDCTAIDAYVGGHAGDVVVLSCYSDG